ncbi:MULTISPECIES: hypothetical protein [Mycobacterium]|uniref:Uncharacterized protein n=4 Tax=Mycobacterium TaxID=1763 RepID=A0A1X1XMR3_9MYCO|nr:MULTISPECIES: hypothetical protein [Mycobacterium]MCV6992836.1 hypothetical protein [Mycobacterium bouchedurhonense]MCV6993319.1 hypothetical protein [Mycobacterium timonense]MDV3305605.1 hypothetical protein [Mycobacterium avium subsp. hominissuis]ORW00145.1 hypothetical protein AWC14_00560 [Mycobacterium kyorinense]PBJ40944.1 hypothetical protein XV03_01005 [Mycobacterium avium subsp. hominissuis]
MCELEGGVEVVHPTLQEVLAGIEDIEAVADQRRRALDQAVGMYLNDVVAPEVGVLVWRGKVAEIQIVDRFCKRDTADIEAILNAVIINAFEAWLSDYQRLLGAGERTA